MENRNGLVAGAEATLATGTAEREAAERLSERLPEGATLGADKNDDAEAFVEGLKAKGIEPHVAVNGAVSKLGKVRKDGRFLGSGRRRRLRDKSAQTPTDRRNLRLGEDHRQSFATEGPRPGQGPRRVRFQLRRL